MKTPSWFLKRNFIACLLWPVSMVYATGFFIVYFYRLFRTNLSKRPAFSNGKNTGKIPVICIGGLLAGGVGKTPIVGEIAKFLPNAAVVMRGYKGKRDGGKGNKLVKKGDSAGDVGDEAKMLSDSGIPVFVGSDREKSIKMAKKAGFLGVVMDDGFQNPTIEKDISILVFDGKIGIGNGFMLPAGPLREPLNAGLRRADAIIIIGTMDDGRRTQKIRLPSSIIHHPSSLPVFLAKTESADPGIVGNIVAFAGIGYPQKFFDGVQKLFGNRLIKTIPFPDHYAYVAADIAQLIAESDRAGATPVTTAKDWVKIPEKYKNKIQVIPLKTTIESAFFKFLKEKLNEA
ncbi:MAG: tetraacyldisaccharide 4'-kinase [Proteobacteria bacterium]|nr:tetraacyldisaccharide 4'-kinase [Pseudomonadota bacterium]